MANFSFNPNDLQRLNRLAFAPRSAAINSEPGQRRSHRSGESTDFLDFRSYTPGDDVRQIDWNVYARLGQVVLRLHEGPRQTAVSLLIDTSRSMSFGTTVSKLEQAQRLACAIGFVALRGGDRLFVSSFAANASTSVGPLTGTRGLAALVRQLQSFDAVGASDLNSAVRVLRQQRRDRGVVVVISDFLNVAGRELALESCLKAGASVLAIQVLDPIDRGEGLQGKIRLRDSESGRQVDVDLDRAALTDFQRRFDQDRARFASFFIGHKRAYIHASTADSYIQVVCYALRSGAVSR